MLITDNPEHAFSYLASLSEKHERPMTIFRSCDFEDEQREEKSFQILHKIIFAMEEGHTCAFHGLEAIYQSLYDLLNQNYLHSRGRTYCTIAVKDESYKRVVHPSFKAIVIMNEEQVYEKKAVDPPFLNRFEKFRFNLSHIFSRRDTTLLGDITRWLCGVCGL